MNLGFAWSYLSRQVVGVVLNLREREPPSFASSRTIWEPAIALPHITHSSSPLGFYFSPWNLFLLRVDLSGTDPHPHPQRLGCIGRSVFVVMIWVLKQFGKTAGLWNWLYFLFLWWFILHFYWLSADCSRLSDGMWDALTFLEINILINHEVHNVWFASKWDRTIITIKLHIKYAQLWCIV